jgi:serine/threonine protein kinase
LGRGTFGKVNIALHMLTRKIVAVKSINKEKIKIEELN